MGIWTKFPCNPKGLGPFSTFPVLYCYCHYKRYPFFFFYRQNPSGAPAGPARHSNERKFVTYALLL